MNYYRMAIRSLMIFLHLMILQSIRAETNIGLIQYEPSAFEGYTLFAPISYTTTYLVNNDGNLVNSWPSSYQPGNVVYLLEDGLLLRTGTIGNPTFTAGGAGGKIQKIARDGSLEWDYTYSSTEHLQHHDVEILPNGNILMIAWEYKSKAAAIQSGRNPALISENKLWPDTVIEVEPSGLTGGNIVWEWHLWDHLVQDYDPARNNYGAVADNPQLVDINYTGNPGSGPADWTHINAIDYNEDFDQILLSVHNFDEIWVIDHSTTTAEAASHSGGNSGRGGDILYRWGNPRTYGAGNASDQKFFGQHDAQWIENGLPGEGNILLFNNGNDRPGNYSSVEEIEPPVDEFGTYHLALGSAYGPVAQTWIYTADGSCDLGIFRDISGLWALRGITRAYFGELGDSPVPEDFDGNSTTDIAIFRDDNGLWAIRELSRIYFGSEGDIPVAGDYDGDGTAGPAIFRPDSGLWALRGLTRAYFGQETDWSIPADYDGDAADDIGIFRSSSGLWAIRGTTRIYYGEEDDQPVTR